MRGYYTLEMLADLYRCTEAALSESEVKIRAKILHRQLNTLDTSWARSNRRFYRHNQLHNFSEEILERKINAAGKKHG